MKLSKLTLLPLLFWLASCSSLQGPGKLQIGNESTTSAGETQASDDEEATPAGGPTVQWSGASRYVQPNEPFNFDWPLDEAHMSRGFSIGGKKSHWGLDLANKKGTPIMASERGVVIYTGHGFHGFGNLIVIEHNGEWATLYAHLSKILIKEGDEVKQGQQIGLMGRTGHATGVHLHFEIRHNRQPVNPLAYLPGGF